MSEDIQGGNVEAGTVLGRDQGSCSTSGNAQDEPCNNYLALSVGGAGVLGD